MHRVPRDGETSCRTATSLAPAVGGRRQQRVAQEFGFAGDGNPQPSLSFDRRDPDLADRVQVACREIMTACVEAGGSITGEHGVGSDKIDYMPLIFDGETLAAMRAVRRAFDPRERANPGKVVPLHACREWRATPAAR